MTRRHPGLAFAAFLALASGARAQSFNVEIGGGHPAPSSWTAAAAGQLGFWNQVRPGARATLLDVSGRPTGVRLRTAGDGNDASRAPIATADAGRTAGPGPHGSLRWSGLAPGRYDVYLYPPAAEGAALERLDRPTSFAATVPRVLHGVRVGGDGEATFEDPGAGRLAGLQLVAVPTAEPSPSRAELPWLATGFGTLAAFAVLRRRTDGAGGRRLLGLRP